MAIIQRIKVGFPLYQDIAGATSRDPNTCFMAVETTEDRELLKKYDRLMKRITRVQDKIKADLMLFKPRTSPSPYAPSLPITCPQCLRTWFAVANGQATKAICDPLARGCGAIIPIRRENVTEGSRNQTGHLSGNTRRT